MRHIAIVGSGPAGYYTAEAAQKKFGDDVRVDIIDRLPVPYGLIRFGVAPDHQSIKGVSKRYEATNLSENVRFVGNVSVGEHVSVAELQDLYDAVVLATGAPNDRALGIPGDDLPGVVGSAAFVGWYNGHPDFVALDPCLAGPGAVVVALDALQGSQIKRVTFLGRRGPHQIAMTPKELGELGHLARATPLVDPADLPPLGDDALLEPGMRKSVTHLRDFAGNNGSAKDIAIEFDFFAMPIAIEGDGKVERIIVERTRLDADLRSVGTGEHYAIPCSLVVACIGYQTPPIDGVPYEHGRGRFANTDGRILPGLYCVGWARRGPSGTIGTNRPDGFAIVDAIAEDMPASANKPGRPSLDALLAKRGADVVTFRDWKKIEEAEIARAREGAPREKFVCVEDMVRTVRAGA
jgi:NADPH-dependent glutamate synthase beta subunit-like oxidoreductase